MTEHNRTRVDAILASLGPGDDLRENVLAAEVLRLRAQWAALRVKVDAMHQRAERAYRLKLSSYDEGRVEALERVQQWMDAGGEGGGA